MLTYQTRKDQVHSAAIATPDDWLTYKSECQDLLRRTWKAVVGSGEDISLPRLDECFSKLAAVLAVGDESASQKEPVLGMH